MPRWTRGGHSTAVTACNAVLNAAPSSYDSAAAVAACIMHSGLPAHAATQYCWDQFVS